MLRLAIAWLLSISPPPGDSPSSDPPSIVGLHFGQEISKRERMALREHFEQALPLACEPPPCTTNCAADRATIGVRVDGSNREYTLSWHAVVPGRSEPVTSSSSCELCGLDELQTQLAADLRTMCARMQSIEGAPGLARISASPVRARVRIDGKRRGRTPWAGELDAGPHQLDIHAPGYGPQTRTLEIWGGLETSEHFELMPTSTRPHPAWPGWTGIGLGVALGVAGAVLIALDGKEYAAQCSGTNVDALGNCRKLYNTQSLGIALAATGAASFATGVGLLIWSQQDQRGVGLAWRGTF